MSWLNLNQSLNSLKGQITNIASEVFSEANVQDPADESVQNNSNVTELEDKCRNLELENASLKKLVDELQTSLQSERLSGKNGVKEEEANWYWDPSPQSSKLQHEKYFEMQIRALNEQISTLKDKNLSDQRRDEELLRLREENNNLSSNLEDLDSQNQVAMERLIALKQELQENFEILKKEHEDLKNTNEENANEMRKLANKINEKDKELETIKSVKNDYDTLSHKYKNLESIYGLLRENAEKFQEENQELHEEVFKLQEYVTKLEHDLELITKTHETPDMVSRSSYEELVKQINLLKDRSNTNQVHLDEINIDDNAKSVIDSLRRDISELKHKLAEKENQGSGDKKAIQPEKVMQLYNKYVNFELPIDYVGEIPSTGDNIVLFKLESVFKTVHSFKKELDILEHKLSEKILNASHLQTQIDDITTENEFLTSDIQHLERELSEMKKNNDFLILEIAALKNTSKLEPIIETHEDNLAKLETELADSNKLNTNFKSEILRVEKELNEVKSEKTALKDSLNDLKNKYTTILSEFDMYKNQSKAVAELEISAKSVGADDLKDAIKEISDLKKQLNSSNSKNEQLSIDIHVLENDKVLLKKQVDDIKIALDEKSIQWTDHLNLKTILANKLLEFANSQRGVTNLKVIDASHDVTQAENDKMIIEGVDELIKENFKLSETVSSLNTEITERKHKANAIDLENNELKNEIENEKQNTLNQEQIHRKEIAELKSQNKKIIDDKVHVEYELAANDAKIRHLEEDLEKLVSDLNDKDNTIHELNTSVEENNGTIYNLHKKIENLENNLACTNIEVENLNKSLKEVTARSESNSFYANKSQQELHLLQAEKEEAAKTVLLLNDEIQNNQNLVSSLSERVDISEKVCNECKAIIDNKDKEIKELNQSLVELTDKIKTSENDTTIEERINQEKQVLLSQMSELRDNLFLKERTLEEFYEKQELFEKTKEELNTFIEKTSSEKNELINLVNLKHNESIQYHNEIQRLNHVILEQNNEYKRLIEEKDSMMQRNNDTCNSCENLRITLKEKNDIILNLNEKLNEYDKLNAELIVARDTVMQLKERCENLDKSLAIQLDTVKALTAQNSQLSDEEKNMERELERLRRHLVETEENYTQELMVSEQKLTECQTRLHTIEERAKQTSTVYTSNSIRANQEVETLRTQIKLLEKQRDEVQAKLSEAEDERSRSEAALTNLQVVLEQFQLDKEREIETATEKIRNKIDEVSQRNVHLHKEIETLNTKLDEALQGLHAAARLGDQLETKTAQINDLKEQVRTLQLSVSAAEERYYNAISNQQDKVDKNLVKNLVVNYVLNSTGNNTNKIQVLRVLSTVLDFNQQECERLGLSRSANTTDSLAAEFVKFLQNESRPRASMPSMMGLAMNNSRSTTPTSRKNSTIGQHPNIQQQPGHSRNPSTGSNNLLFTNIDSIETSSHRSRDSDREPKVLSPSLDTGVNQTRNTEGAILKSVLKDM